MASDSELESALSEGVEALATGVVEYQVQGLRVRRAENPLNHLKAQLMLRALNSPNRGIAVAQVARAGVED